ncbi:ATP-binding protein [Terasakiella sp. A23]|uniref:ATP-binding protein n=1 Tax=Terasakiella sp. FCG-A23 TaxID=3080561 RepID=UPI0029538B3F|nr:ATP-binding protein [Terasakiella sp. A23]MDV7341842.1 ATP-binding protein [Terasakiella sp. A23]
MNAVLEVNALKVDDQDFLVASTIDRCPKVMMIRELFKNAVEAATQAVNGEPRVTFGVTHFNDIPKLTIWNTGPGMDDAELVRMTNLAASIRKTKGLDDNFGMGAKVASLPSNKEGLRYRSCKGGVVHEVILAHRSGVYGRINRFDEYDNEIGDVIEVTELVHSEGKYDVLTDWTEVVLLGNHPDQNTVSDPYDGNPKQEKQWLATYLYHRFYHLPCDLMVRMEEGTHKLQSGSRQFETIPNRLRFFEQNETVKAENGIKIHYLYDKPLAVGGSHNNSISGSVTSDVSTCAIIFKDEMYDLMKKKEWKLHAPTFGVPFGAQHLSVHVELPNDANVRPDAYRQFLRYIDGEQDAVGVMDFANLVIENRPEWFIDLIHSFAPTGADSDDTIRNTLQDMLNKLRVQTTSPRIRTDGLIQLDAGNGNATQDIYQGEGNKGGKGSREGHIDFTVTSHGSKMASMMKNLERAPTLIRLEEDYEIEEKKLKGRAGRYYQSTGDLFLNMKYPVIEQMFRFC